ncbi:MAG: GDSL-type esterase/lipase family protein [Bacteroidales bacterium]|nr:GDSL-type esterase/lipase family protein [Bacteroidales bacterium]
MKAYGIISRLRAAAIALVALLATGACDDNDISELTFVGDSIIARWDLDEYFTGYVTVNLGKSGAGIDYVESLKGRAAGRDAVVMIGTNDMAGIRGSQSEIELYVSRYVDAVTGLGARHTYLYSILPRDFKGEVSLLPTISEVNRLVKEAVAGRADVTYLDVYPLFVDGDGLDYALYSDRLHLSAAGYEVLAKSLLSQL